MNASRFGLRALPLVAALGAGAGRPAPVDPMPAPAPTLSKPSTDSAFEASVKPILVESCMPCHFPGGRMYDRLPFDEPATIRGHPDGVLRRLKDPAKKQTVEAWLAAR